MPSTRRRRRLPTRSSPLAWALAVLSISLYFSPTARPAPGPDTGAGKPKWIWFEAEPNPGQAGGDPELSAGQQIWLGPGATLRHPVTIPASGTYTLWVRKFWNPQTFRWRCGADAAWQESANPSLVDLLPLGDNASRRVGWALVGTVELPAGPRDFQLEVPAEERNTTGYDCFVLTTGTFLPHGLSTPDATAIPIPENWFAFQPGPDAFTNSPIDLRFLNEPVAGAGGPIRCRGEDFIHESTGEPIRFWGVNVGMGFVDGERRRSPSVGEGSNAIPSRFDRFARAMAKRGVNLVRIHGPVYQTSGPDLGRLDTGRVARVQAFVAALARQGIYSALSLYFPLWVTPGPDQPVLPGYRSDEHPFALLYFHPGFQALYREWWRGLLDPVNPHTGLPLKHDPAVAFVEMINEDSTLFWTFNPSAGAKGNLPDVHRLELQRRFVAWLQQRYPGQSAADIVRSAWEGVTTAQDDPAAGTLGFRPLWEIAHQRNRRDQDTARFLTELMRDFHRETYSLLKTNLGFRGLVYASNWKTASPQFLDPLDKYANATADFFDRHGYLEGFHQGPNAAWNIEPKQTFDDRSALKLRHPEKDADDFDNPIFDVIYQQRPSIITEVNWPLPNRHRADMVLVGASYGALQGTDAIAWFAADTESWEPLPGKFSIQTPVVLGQFPGAALIYRRGLVRTAPRVVHLEAAVEDLFALRGTPLAAPANLDALRLADTPTPAGETTRTSTNTTTGVDPLAFLVGRVAFDFIEHAPSRFELQDLKPFVDRAERRVRSQTDELTWDWGQGTLAIRAPAAQGFTGFLAEAGTVELPDLRLASSLEYGSILLVSLDNLPLARSRRLLLQVASEERPTRWTTSTPTGKRTLTDRGVPPLLVRNFAGHMELKRADAPRLRVQPLGFDGYPQAAPALVGSRIELGPQTPYYLIEANPD